MIKGTASKHFMVVITHSLAICLTSVPSWHWKPLYQSQTGIWQKEMIKWWNMYPDWESVRLCYWWITEEAVTSQRSLNLIYGCLEYILGHLRHRHISSQTLLQSSLSVCDLLWEFLPPHSNTQMSTHSACYDGNNRNKWSHRSPKHVFLPNIKMITPPQPLSPSTHSPSPVSLGDLPGLWGQDRTGEDKLQPQSPGSLSCFHLHQQLISHHWRALARQAEDFIRDVLYGP